MGRQLAVRTRPYRFVSKLPPRSPFLRSHWGTQVRSELISNHLSWHRSPRRWHATGTSAEAETTERETTGTCRHDMQRRCPTAAGTAMGGSPLFGREGRGRAWWPVSPSPGVCEGGGSAGRGSTSGEGPFSEGTDRRFVFRGPQVGRVRDHAGLGILRPSN